jgi:hypothetical protein
MFKSEINVVPYGRRDAGAAHHLHGDGAAAGDGRSGEAAAENGQGTGQGSKALETNDKPLVISLTAGGETFINETQVSAEELHERIADHRCGSCG